MGRGGSAVDDILYGQHTRNTSAPQYGELERPWHKIQYKLDLELTGLDLLRFEDFRGWSGSAEWMIKSPSLDFINWPPGPSGYSPDPVSIPENFQIDFIEDLNSREEQLRRYSTEAFELEILSSSHHALEWRNMHLGVIIPPPRSDEEDVTLRTPSFLAVERALGAERGRWLYHRKRGLFFYLQNNEIVGVVWPEQ